MPWKNIDGEVSELRPTRVRLENSETRTAEEVTDEVLVAAGWCWEEPIVVVEPVEESVVVVEPATEPETVSLTYRLDE